jgi:hypothetical protein
MSTLAISPLLRFALRLDAVASATVGVLTLIGANPVSSWVGAPGAAVVVVGAFMLVYGAAIGWLSTYRRLDIRLVWAVIVGNLVWVVGSVLLTTSDWLSPATLGLVLLLGQALAVAVFAQLQYLGLRQSRALVAA